MKSKFVFENFLSLLKFEIGGLNVMLIRLFQFWGKNFFFRFDDVCLWKERICGLFLVVWLKCVLKEKLRIVLKVVV
jgi:hypothetical protein